MAAWRASGLPVAVTPLITPGHADPASVIDVRQAAEYAGGHLPGARGIELGGLASVAADLTGRPVVTMCGHGERAATAASVLERAGIAGSAVFRGGPQDWAQASGEPLEANT
jgi:hydroxyacylglutathione hydrolase